MGTNVTRRSVLLAGGTSAVALAACAGPGRPSQGQSGAPLSQEAATVTFLGRGSLTYQESFQMLSRRFTQEVAPKITVEFSQVEGNFDQKYQVLAASGSVPDVGFGTVANYKVHVARGNAAYLDELAKRDKQFKEADYDAFWLEALRYKGRLAGLPWDPAMVVLNFNRSIFTKEGMPVPKPDAPMLWDDVVALAQRATKDSGQLDQAGLEVWWARMWWHVPRQLGLPDVYNGDEHVLKLDHPIAIEAIQWLADLRTKFKVSRAVESQGPPTNFVSGKLAMDVSGAYTAANNRRDLQDDWDWAPMPQFKGKPRVAMGQASPFILGAASRVKDQAWQLMRFLAGPVGHELAMEKGIAQPMLKAARNSPTYTRLKPPHAHGVVVDETKYGVPPPYGPTYTDVQALVDKVLAPVYRGEQTARQALTASAGEFKALMDEAKARFG